MLLLSLLCTRCNRDLQLFPYFCGPMFVLVTSMLYFIKSSSSSSGAGHSGRGGRARGELDADASSRRVSAGRRGRRYRGTRSGNCGSVSVAASGRDSVGGGGAHRWDDWREL